MEQLYGSYKISAKLLHKMVSAHVTHNGAYASLSRYEVLAILHLTHIADTSGYVEHFRASEFISAIGCSRREAFSLIHSLEDKGYVKVYSSDWKCCFGIKILDNDFSAYNKSMRYLNTNHDFFVSGGICHADFCALSVTAMKLLLFLMYNYSLNYGYHISYSSVMASLGIKSRRVISRSLKEISPLLSGNESFYRIREDIKRGLRYGYLDILSGLRMFEPNTGIPKEQDSYFKRHIRGIVAEGGYSFSGIREDKNTLLSRIFGIFNNQQGKPFDRLLSLFKKRLDMDGCVDELTLYHLSADFEAALS